MAKTEGARNSRSENRVSRIMAWVAWIGFLVPLAAGGAEPLKLSLREAVARALSDGTTARIAAERVETSRAQAGQARSALLPEVIGEVQDANEVINLKTFGLSVPGFPSIVGPFNVFDAHVRLASRVIDLAAYRRYKAARQGISVADADREKTENEVAAAVATLYVGLQRAQASVEATRANVDLFTKLRDLAEDQRRSGVGTKLDSTRAEVALSRQRQQLLVDENRRDATRLSLLHAIGEDQTREVELTDSWREETAGFATPEEAVAAARDNRPELHAIDERIRAAELSIGASRAEKLPTLGAQFQGGYNGNHLGDLSWNRTVAALVSVPVFTGGRIPAAIAEAESRKRELRLERTEAERQVEEDVRRAFLNFQSAANRAGVAEENVKLASDELEFARDRFSSGVSSSIEVDNAQTSYAAARADQIAALADRAQAYFDLSRATGRIRDLIGEKEQR
jgi:outer membrane protein TolC